MDSEYDYDPTQSGTANNQYIAIDTGKWFAVIAICSALCGIAAIGSFIAYTKALQVEKETRLTQYYLMDPHSRTPDELAAWAKFNREHESRIKEK